MVARCIGCGDACSSESQLKIVHGVQCVHMWGPARDPTLVATDVRRRDLPVVDACSAKVIAPPDQGLLVSGLWHHSDDAQARSRRVHRA
jgi:hypothetical protein